ncbi:MAG: hypothetical protein U0136_11785 [Bdellovibrionota bacterium]
MKRFRQKVFPHFVCFLLSILCVLEARAAAPPPGVKAEELLHRAQLEILSAAKSLAEGKFDVTDRSNLALLSALKKTDKGLDLALEGAVAHDERMYTGIERASSALIELDTILAAEPQNARRVASNLKAAGTIMDSLVAHYSRGLSRLGGRLELRVFERDFATRISESLVEVRTLMFNVQGSLSEEQALVPIIARLIEEGRQFPEVIPDAPSYVVAVNAARGYLNRVVGASYFLEPRNMAAWSALRRPLKRLQAAVAEAGEYRGPVDLERLAMQVKPPRLDRAPLLADREKYKTWLHGFEIIPNDEVPGFVATGKIKSTHDGAASAGGGSGDQDEDLSATDNDAGDADAEEDADE